MLLKKVIAGFRRCAISIGDQGKEKSIARTRSSIGKKLQQAGEILWVEWALQHATVHEEIA